LPLFIFGTSILLHREFNNPETTHTFFSNKI
jgi:hypothetical protein